MIQFSGSFEFKKNIAYKQFATSKRLPRTFNYNSQDKHYGNIRATACRDWLRAKTFTGVITNTLMVKN